jgi:hypothetical protein
MGVTIQHQIPTKLLLIPIFPQSDHEIVLNAFPTSLVDLRNGQLSAQMSHKHECVSLEAIEASLK